MQVWKSKSTAAVGPTVPHAKGKYLGLRCSPEWDSDSQPTVWERQAAQIQTHSFVIVSSKQRLNEFVRFYQWHLIEGFYYKAETYN